MRVLFATALWFAFAGCGKSQHDGDARSETEHAGEVGAGGNLTTNGGNGGVADGTGAGTSAASGRPGGSAGHLESCDPSAPPEECGGPAPSSGTIVDFGRYGSSTLFGEPNSGDITGSLARYSSGSSLGQPTIAVSLGGIEITGSVSAGGTLGWIFSFDRCVDASAFDGIGFLLGGSVGNASLNLTVQTNADFPINPAAKKGACHYASCDDRAVACVMPSTSIAVPVSVEDVSEAWSSFTGGVPESGVTPEGIGGLAFTVDCPADGGSCSVDLTLGTLRFIQL